MKQKCQQDFFFFWWCKTFVELHFPINFSLAWICKYVNKAITKTHWNYVLWFKAWTKADLMVNGLNNRFTRLYLCPRCWRDVQASRWRLTLPGGQTVIRSFFVCVPLKSTTGIIRWGMVVVCLLLSKSSNIHYQGATNVSQGQCEKLYWRTEATSSAQYLVSLWKSSNRVDLWLQ